MIELRREHSRRRLPPIAGPVLPAGILKPETPSRECAFAGIPGRDRLAPLRQALAPELDCWSKTVGGGTPGERFDERTVNAEYPCFDTALQRFVA